MIKESVSLLATALPQELVSFPQWVGWRFEDRNGKKTKVPINPHTGGRASTTDPTTWSDFETALRSCEQHGLDGVGFVFTEDDPFVGIDLDGVRDPQTGELDDTARKIIKLIDSYTEVSPSGTGIHIITRGKPLEGKRKTLPGGRQIEIYSQRRYFTITGQHVEGTPLQVEERSRQVAALYRKLFGTSTGTSIGDMPDQPPDIEIQRRAEAVLQRVPKEVRERWGRVPDSDRSGWEFHLACKAIEAGVTDEMDLACFVFAAAAHQDKFGTRADNWIRAVECARKAQGVAKEALAGSEHKPSFAPRIISAEELLRTHLPEPKWAVPDILPEGLTLLAGKPKMGKSWLALGLALAVSTGAQALNHVQTERGHVLYLALEDSKKRLQSRLEKLMGPPFGLKGDKLLFLPQRFDNPNALDLATEWPRINEGGLEELQAWLNSHPDARLIIVDTLEKIRPREKDNGNLYRQDYSALEGLKKLADTFGVAILVVHHLRKTPSEDPLDMVSGSTGLVGAADSVLVLRRERGRADAVLHITGRDVGERELALKWDKDTALWSVMGDADEFRQTDERRKILKVIEENGAPMSPTEVAVRLKKNRNAVNKLMWAMSRDGDLRWLGGGKYDVVGER